MEWNAENIREKYGFDAVGIVRKEGKSIIILGLKTRPERDLDEFIGGDTELKNWCFSGFKKYFSPLVDSFLFDFEKIDKEAKPIAGYDESLNLKELAVRAGIGTQGRNTLIMNHRFQSRLRFRAIKSTADIKPTGNGFYRHLGNFICDQCRLCELACPTQVLKDYKHIDQKSCIAHRQLTNRTPNLVRCNLCWIACTKDYDWAQQMAHEKDKVFRELLP